MQSSLFLVVPAALALGWAATVAADDDDQKFPATGQTTCWNSSGVVIPCEDTGHDGDIQAGATLSYKDNRNGTITDQNTRLVWEKKDDNNVGGIHDKDKPYFWDQAFDVHVFTSITLARRTRTCHARATRTVPGWAADAGSRASATGASPM